MRNWAARIHESSLGGLKTVVMENELLRLTFLVEKGADLVELNYKPHDLDFAWWSAQGLTAAKRSGPGSASAEFLDRYEGGWQEILPNGGESSAHRGGAFPQHGDIWLQRWDHRVLQDDPHLIRVAFSVRSLRVPVLVSRTITLAGANASFEIDSQALNESAVAVDVMWGHHITFGRPFLRPGCTVEVPNGTEVLAHPQPINPPRRRVSYGAQPYAWPNAAGPDQETIDLSVLPPAGTPSELVYLSGMREGAYSVMDPDIELGLRVEWDIRVLPYLWFWQEFGEWTDYPWYGRHYNIGLEPFSSYPSSGIREAVRNGTVLTLEPGDVRRNNMRVTVIDPNRAAQPG